jgi:crossover junction endodeoxyribonuclease RuvC
LTRVASGTLRPKRDARFDFRLAVIRHGVLLLLEEHKPGLVGVESPYVPQPKANMSPEEARRLAGMLGGVLMLAQARGAVASAIGESERKLGVQLPIEQLAPSSVKAAVAGNGRAKKPEVADGVRRVLGLGLAKLQEDEADALAVAIAAALTWRTK